MLISLRWITLEKRYHQFDPGIVTWYRTVFNLYVIEGYSHKEIGNILGISEGTSKSQLARAKAILQRKVQEHLDANRKSFTRNS